MVEVDKSGEKRAVILFSTEKDSGQAFYKNGVEAKWRVSEVKTPCMYLAVK